MVLGYISRVALERGIGFIVEDGQTDEIEFHWSAVRAGGIDQLRAGQRVEFELREDHRSEDRYRALNVRLVGGA